MYIYDMTKGKELDEMSTIDIVEYKRDILLQCAYRYFARHADMHLGEFYAQRACEQWCLTDYQMRVLHAMRQRAWRARSK